MAPTLENASLVPSTSLLQSDLLREQQEAHQHLLNDNFNKALRINYLEERLLEYTKGGAFTDEALSSEVFQLRLVVAEKEQQLKERDVAMIRATDSLCRLQQQLKKSHQECAEAKEKAERMAVSQGDEAIWAERVEMLRKELQELEYHATNMENRVNELEHEVEARDQREKEIQHQYQVKRMEYLQGQEQWKAQMDDLERQYDKTIQELENANAKSLQQMQTIEQLRVESAQDTRTRVDMECKAVTEHWQAQLKPLRNEIESLTQERNNYMNERQQLVTENQHRLMQSESEKQQIQDQFTKLQYEYQHVTRDLEQAKHRLSSLENALKQDGEIAAQFEHQQIQYQNKVQILQSQIEKLKNLASEKDMERVAMESRLKTSEIEIMHVRNKLEMEIASRSQSMEEQVTRLECRKQEIESENVNLRKQSSHISSELARVDQRRKMLQHQLEEQTSINEGLKSRLAKLEKELMERTTQTQQLQLRLEETQNAARAYQQRHNWEAQTNEERRALMMQLQEEKAHNEALKIEADKYKRHLVRWEHDWKTAKSELATLVGNTTSSLEEKKDLRNDINSSDMSLTIWLRAANENVAKLKREMTESSATMQARWGKQVTQFEKALTQLASQLGKTEANVEQLERSSRDGRTTKEELERQNSLWRSKFETACFRVQEENKHLHEALEMEKVRVDKLESALEISRQELQKRDISKNKEGAAIRILENEYHDLKLQYRLRTTELKERQQSAQLAREQHLAAVQENRDLLKAIQVYRNTIAKQERDFAQYTQTQLEHTKKLTRQSSLEEVKETLVAQLRQTQRMITMTQKRWKNIGIFASDSEHVGVGLRAKAEVCKRRLEALMARWNECGNDMNRLARQFSRYITGRAISDGKTMDTQSWMADVNGRYEQVFSRSVRLITEISSVCSQIVGLYQNDCEKSKVAERMTSECIPPSNKMNTVDREFDRRMTSECIPPPKKTNTVQCEYDPSMRNEGLWASCSSTRSQHSSAVYENGVGVGRGENEGRRSLSSLQRMSEELRAIENKIQRR